MNQNEIEIGGTFLFVPAFKEVTKEQFFSMYKGKVSFDLSEAWEKIQERLGRNEEEEPKEQLKTNVKVSKHKKRNQKS